MDVVIGVIIAYSILFIYSLLLALDYSIYLDQSERGMKDRIKKTKKDIYK